MDGNTLNKYEKGQICVLSDKSLIQHPHWDDLSLLREFPVLWLDVNEANKSLEIVQQVWDYLFEHALTRRGLLICVGGGVLTDIGGFAASTYKRGIDYINVPTTLLAMVDASSGGKTGINYHGLKNTIGTFAQPVQTIIDPQWLTTLPSPQMLSGFGEMLKTGLLDAELWHHLLQYDLDAMDIAALTPLINHCLTVKQNIVASDPLENGPRKALNLGHTFGHALEELSIANAHLGVEPLDHGYAVLYGLIAELYLSVTLLGCPKEPLQQLTQIMLHAYGKPNCKCTDMEPLIALMRQDKKNERAAEINCTLLQSIGSPLINQVISESQAREALDYLFSL